MSDLPAINVEDYRRGDPQDPEAKARNAQIRQYVSAWSVELEGEFPEGFELWDLVCGEVELVDLHSGGSHRLYLIGFEGEDEPRLIIDDYLPSEDSTIPVSAEGVPLEEVYDEPETLEP